ncbi:PEP-CTERM sorting domain-containing protein [Longimicrobium sp.]|uniref:PEP-CTERM sorting domain-containing protein n=1 Tax=Longimicrobium sp. TaxID=2029185 RepID=UPI002D808609|nr:PEP-CTERM sorting domain-containing protein [Longimicrobium sp.]
MNVCGAALPGLTTCASVKLQVVGNNVTLWVKNLSGLYGSYQNFVFTSISFFNANAANGIPDAVEGNVTTMTGPYRTSNASNPPPSWAVVNNGGAGGTFGLDFDAGVNGNDGSIASSCGNILPGGSNNLWMTPTCGSGNVTDGGPDFGWVTMTFSMTGAWNLDATDTQIQIHAQSDQGSVKCTTGVDCDPTSTTPEPVTLALVGTGLAGLAGAYRRRRRNGGEGETPA